MNQKIEFVPTNKTSSIPSLLQQQKQRPLKVIFCLPGPSFSGQFLQCWSELLLACTRNNIIPILSQQYDAVVYYVRNKCLGGSVLRGKNQLPFDGKIDYDFLMWIDSDIIFNVDDFFKLLNHARQKDVNIVSGIYKTKDQIHYPIVEKWDENFFAKNGYFKFWTDENIKNQKTLVPVEYTGFGFLLCKRGVFESLNYPWFEPIFYDIGIAHDFCSEDVGFCKKVLAKGFKIHIDPKIRVGHEKKVIL